MDLRRASCLLLLLALQLGLFCSVALANVVFPVQHRFRGRPRSLPELKAHDSRRRGRFLSAVDMQLGGDQDPAETGLYFTKIGLGTPSKDYYVQVDTGSDTLWVSCVGCDKCPTKSDLDIDLKLYDPKGSSTSSLVKCDDDFCVSAYNGKLAGCKPNVLCQYSIQYGDGSETVGYYVKDAVTLDRVTGNLQTASMNGTLVFGCSAKQSGQLVSSSEALDGILGFGQANSSAISQLAAAGKVKKVFSHCLDGKNGGGIFAIGEVIQPKVKSTPIVPNQAHYNVILKEVQVGGDVLELPTDIFGSGDDRGAIIDSGTTLTYLPQDLYDSLMTKILEKQPGLKMQLREEQFYCFNFIENVDNGFPTVTLHFEDSLKMTVYPHDYLFRIAEDSWCFGWQSQGSQSKDGKDVTLLGDMVLSNKLVIYDLENQTIGWTDYNCSSRIKVKDEGSGAQYFVGSHDLSSASGLPIARMLTFLMILIALLHSFTV